MIKAPTNQPEFSAKAARLMGAVADNSDNEPDWLISDCDEADFQEEEKESTIHQ